MVFYYDSYPTMLTAPTSRHHQFGAMGHHYPYGQTQPPSSSQFPTSHHQEMPCGMTQFGNPMDAGVQLQTPWHAPTGPNSSSVFSTSSSCSRTPVYDEWSPRSPCAHLGTGPSCGSPANGPYNANGVAGYKLGSVQDFSAAQHHQPPQDLSIHGGGGQQSPDSGLTVSSDGVSSSDSPSGTANHVLAGLQQHTSVPAQQGLRPPIIRSPYDWIKKPSYQTQCNPGKTRTKDKYRVVYSDIQRLELEKEFYSSRYITIRRKAELAQLLGLSERQVKIWFQNRRAKERKQVKKREELVQKEKDIVVHHHLQPLQMSTANGIGNKMISLD